LVMSFSSTTNGFVVTTDTRFLYDGWNVIAEFNFIPQTSSFILSASYAWGLDLSGTETGAGGVGGLLLTAVSSTSTGLNNIVTSQQRVLAPLFDGNGNVLAYAVCSTGQVLARYEYDPFGKLLIKDEDTSVAGRLHHQFSTKYCDAETGLSYYGYRYYSAELGRWVSKDPIAEKGGINLYAMCSNDALSMIDPDGRTAGYVFAGAAGVCALPYVIAAHVLYSEDKTKHCWVSCMISRQCGIAVSAAGGVVKELRDLLLAQGLDDSLADMAANANGYVCAGAECSIPLVGMVTRWFRDSCEDCCKSHGYD
ncbi:MAG: RHS repeat-associated core domain-containing protein, partial [Fimbriimonadaceae bacterium]